MDVPAVIDIADLRRSDPEFAIFVDFAKFLFAKVKNPDAFMIDVLQETLGNK